LSKVSLKHIQYQCKAIEAVLYQHLKSWFPEMAFMRRVELSYEELDDLIRAERRRLIDRVLADYLNEIYPDGPTSWPSSARAFTDADIDSMKPVPLFKIEVEE